LFLTSFLLSLLLLHFPFRKNITAAENFDITTRFEHTLEKERIITEAVMQIKSDTPRVISYYTAIVPLERVRVECKNLSSKKEIECTTFNRGSSTEILINLNNSVVQPDIPINISLTYSTETLEKSSYNILSEIHEIKTTSVLIRYPKEKGEPLWTSDPIQNIKTVGPNYEISINNPTHTNISLLFGQQLLYKFDINKVFSNSLDDQNQTFEIYVPSDTSTQIVIWEEIDPLPDSTLKDEDGNYLFKYIVPPDETLNCKISGYIQKIESLEYEDAVKNFLVHKTGYWSINDNAEFKRVNTFLQKRGLKIENDFDDIEKLESTQQELFYKYIYEYVLERLNYPEDVTLGITNQARLGANTLVDTPNNASPLDYVDFYIALLRRYNVPSRLVVGYISNISGYTSDGFYHHWVEYLDMSAKKWQTADPFLDEYFSKNLFGSAFLDHLAVVRRGKSAVAPKMSFFQETDFVVKSETEKDISPTFSMDSKFTVEEYKITHPYIKGYIQILNTGNIAINSYEIIKSNIGNIQRYADPVNNLQSQIILPKQNSSIQFNIPYTRISSSNIFVNIELKNLDRYNKEETLETQVEENVPLYISIISKIISILIFCVMLFLIYFLVLTFKKKSKKRNE
jgi:hypothetical protein